MEYLFLGLIVWVFLSLPALIYAGVIEGRRRRDAEKVSLTLADLMHKLEMLERRTHAAPASDVISKPVAQQTEIEKKPSPPLEVPPRPEPTVQWPAIPAAHPIPAREITHPPVPVVHPGPEAPAQSPPLVPIKPAAQAPPAGQPEAVPLPPAMPTPAITTPAHANLAARVQAPPPPPMRNVHAPAFQQTTRPLGNRVEFKKKSLSLEEALGTNWFPKLGITAVVIGVGLLVGASWGAFAPWLRVLILYAGAFGLLGVGILLERKEQYRVLGRSLIGGGWAVGFLVTYAISHAQSLLVLTSQPVDLFLMLAVTSAMVWHTLKYDSQLVTGLAFLLGFTAVALNSDPPYNLIAGAMLVTGMTVIVLRRQWFELEVFGILAAYLNHLLWLYPIIDAMGSRKHDFPQFPASMALLGFYWVVFRASYLLRKPSSVEKENVSTIAALINSGLLLGVMKYQSFHPEMAFYALLALGAVEFTLGQLPASRRRIAPFKILSSMGALLMIVAVPFRYSGNPLELLWLAGAESFLFAGIFTRERLFRGFGLIASFLVASYAVVFRLGGLIEEVLNTQPHYHRNLGIVFAVITLALYTNAHVTRWLWPELFEKEPEKQSLAGLSFAGSLLAMSASFALAPDTAVALVLMLVATVLSWSGRQFRIDELIYEAHWITAIAVIQLVAVGQNTQSLWNGIPYRFVMFLPVAALVYLSSRFVRLSRTQGNAVFSATYMWAGTGLLAVLIWYQMLGWAIAVLWVALGLALCAAAELFHRSDLKWQALVLVLFSFGRAVLYNFSLHTTTHGLSYRLLTVSVVAAGIYLLARWTPRSELRPIYSVLGTILLGYLAYDETPQPWTGVAWVGLAALLSLAARLWKDRALLWQTHLLSVLAAGWTFYTNFAPQYRGGRVQLISVAITAILLYLLNWNTNIRSVIEDERICHGYSWAASLLLSWLAWYQFAPVNVSLAWGVFGLLLFEVSDLTRIGQGLTGTNLRAQSYVALVAGFAHLFYSNFDSRALGTWNKVLLDPRIITVLPLIVILFWVYGRLHAPNTVPGAAPGAKSAMKSRAQTIAGFVLACLGTAAIASLIRFESNPEAMVIGYAAMVVGLEIVALLTSHEVFLFQSLAMLGVAGFRIATHNFFYLHESFSSSLQSSIWALVLLAIGIPLSFLVRRRERSAGIAGPGWARLLFEHPEQPMFFVPVVLLAVLLALKMPGGMITLAWGIQGVLVFVLALLAKERSYRLTGVALLIVCLGKIVIWDVWQINDPRARYLTLIGVGALLLVVSFLYGKNREALREYL